MQRWRGGLAGALLAGSLAGAAAAAPPPPPPAWMDDLAARLVPTPTAAGFPRYAAALADDLVVQVDGAGVAATKRAWLAIERARLGRVDRVVIAYAEGRDAILVVDRFDDRSGGPAGPGLVFDARPVSRAVQYVAGPDRLIHLIRIVRADGALRLP